MQKNTRQSVLQLVQMAMLAAISVVSISIVRFPLLAAAPYLEYDIADVFILIGTMLFGPIPGLLILTVASVVQALTVSASSGIVGLVMHLAASGVLVLVSGIFYKKCKKKFWALVVGLILGTVAMVLLMIPLNLTLTVYYNGVPYEAMKAAIWPVIIPFNAMKGGLNSLFTILVFPPLALVLKKTKLLER